MNRLLTESQPKSFRDKYLALILVFVALFIGGSASAQVDTTKQRQRINAYGYDYKNIAIDSSFRIPQDTFRLKMKDSGAIASKGGVIYIWTGVKWDTASGKVETDAPIIVEAGRVKLNYDQSGLKVTDDTLQAKAKVFGSYTHLRGIPLADTMATYAVYENKTFHYFKYDPDDASSADDSAAVIVAGGKRFKRIFNGVYRPEDFGAKGDGTTDDSWAWQKLFNYIGSGGGAIEADGKKTYKFDNVVDLPVNSSLHTPIVVNLNGAKIVGNRIFRRRPADQGVAVAQTNTRIIIQDGKFSSVSSTGSLALEIGATYGSVVQRNVFYNYDTAVAFKFGLMSKSEQNIYSFCKNGLIFGNGDWLDAGLANAQSNSSVSVQDRFYNPVGAEKSIAVLGASGVVIANAIIEGNAPQYGIYFNALGSTVVKDLRITDAHIEVATGRAGIYLEPNGGTFTIDGVFQQYEDTLLVVNRYGGNPVIRVSKIPNVSLSKFTNNSTQAFWEFSNMPSGFTYNGNFVVSGSYILPTTIGYLGYDGYLRGTAPGILNVGGIALVQATTIRLIGAITPNVDNTYSWGTASVRPANIYTRNLHIFESSTLQFSNTSGTSDIALNRTDTGVLRINSTGNMVWPRGTTAQRRPYQVSNTLGSTRYNTETNKFEGLWGSTYRNFASETYADSLSTVRADSIAAHRTRLQKIEDSLFSHNNRIIKNTDSISVHNTRILQNVDSIYSHNNRILKVNDTLYSHNNRLSALENTTGGGSPSSETLVKVNDADYTITTGTGNIIVHYFNELTAVRTVTLPDPATNTGRIITIKHGGAGAFVINYSANVYENSTTWSTSLAQGGSTSIMSDGTQWIKIR